MSTNNAQAKSGKTRPTIGVIVDSMGSSYQISLWRSLKDAAQIHDVNLLCFLGGAFGSAEEPQLANAIYKFIHKNSVNGLIVLTGTVGFLLEPETLEAYFEQFQPLPMVSIAGEIRNIPCILLDNRHGIAEIVSHLIETHKYRRIGFVRMREGYQEGDDRFQAYIDTLAEYGLPYDPELVVPGEYYDDPEGAVRLLYDERKVSPEAIVSVDDYMALPIVQILQSRGISVPRDVAVVGFDDVEETQFTDPPLTTLQQPLWQQAQTALEIILSSLSEEKVPSKVLLSPKLILRESCGCSHASGISKAMPELDQESAGEKFSHKKSQIISFVLNSSDLQEEQAVSELVEAFSLSLEKDQSEPLSQTLKHLIQQGKEKNENPQTWQSAISALHAQVIHHIQDQASLTTAEKLLHQARIQIAEIAQREQAILRFKLQQLNTVLHNLSQELSVITNINGLMSAIDQVIPFLGISEYAITLYDLKDPLSDQLTLTMARTQTELADLPSKGLVYSSDRILPEIFMPHERRFTKMVESLHFGDDQFGFIVLEDQAFIESVYDTLAEQISSGMKGTLLVQQVEQRAIQLQAASEVSQAASTFLDPADLVNQVVMLVKKRFDLYYVGLFLLDEKREWAVLRAGTDEAGEKMLAENWRLEIGGDSMIGRCISSAEPDIQLDVDKAPVHLRNPYLPETKSELALPLISRGEILGAMTIQSAEANAFSTEDFIVFQTMVNQISAALANAQLFGQTQNALMETETLLNVSRMANSTVGIDFALPQILDLVLKATQIDAGLLSLYNPVTRKLEIITYQLPDPLYETLSQNGLEGTLCDLVFQQRRSLLLNNLETDSPIDTTGLQNLGFKSYQGVPIDTRSEIYGTLCTFSKYVLTSEDSRIGLLGALGQQVGIALENSRLFEQTQAALRQTADLFSGSERIVRSNNTQAVLDALVESTALQEMDRIGLLIFDHPLEEDTPPTNLTLSANWSQPNNEVRASVGTVYNLEEYPLIEVLGLKEPVFIRDCQTDPTVDENSRRYLVNVLAVKSAVSLPLVVGGHSIGGIVAFSSETLALTDTEVRQISSLTDQAATVIQSILLNEQTRATLAELEATQRRYQIQAWSSYNQARERSGYQQTREGVKPVGKQPIPQVKEAIEKVTPLIDDHGDQPILTVPIMLRDQPIGAIGLQGNENKRRWTHEEISLVQEISEQFALAAESLRLLDETQRRAARERLVAEITAKLRATNDPQTMLQTAAAELREALKVKRAQVLLQPNQLDDNQRGEE